MMHQNFQLAAVIDAGAAKCLEYALTAVPGVAQVKVEHADGQISLTYDEGKTSLQELLERLKLAGYPAQEPQRRHAAGSCCGGCGG
jgi:copper chaperone CopZ